MKKILKNIAIVLVFFALSSFFSGCQNGDKAYNDAIKTRFEQVEETLTKRLYENTNYVNWTNREITHVKFLETKEEIANLQVFYEGDFVGDIFTTEEKGYANYRVLIDDYNALVEAETSGNALYYLDALENIFTNMNLVEAVRAPFIVDLTLINSSEVESFNNIFNLNDVENEDIVRQVGFLPYHIELVDYHYNVETFLNEYTYKLSGISYCETKSENNDEIKQHEKLLIEDNYNKNHIKTFNRDVLFTSSSYSEGGMDFERRLLGDILKIIDNVNEEYTVKTTLFKEVDLLKIYEDIKDGDFYYKKPKDFNVKEYLENI